MGVAEAWLWSEPRDARLAFAMMKRNLWIWSAVLSTLSLGALSKIVMKVLAGREELGLYAVAWQVVILDSLPVVQMARMGDPRMARMVLAKSRSRRLGSRCSTERC